MISPIALLIKATLVLAAALGLDAVLRRRNVLSCAAMWNAALLVLALLPVAMFAVPPLELPWLSRDELRGSDLARIPREVQPWDVTQRGAGDDAAADLSSGNPGNTPASSLPQLSMTERLSPRAMDFAWFLGDAPWRRIALVLYLAGFIAFGCRLAGSLAAVACMQIGSQPVLDDDWNSRLAYWRSRLGIRCPVGLRVSPSLQTLFVVGHFRPQVFISRELAGSLLGDRRDAVLVHELSHVARGDYGWQLLQRFVQCVLWFHPLAWLAARRMHFIRERACDDFTVHSLRSGDDYIDVLVEVAGHLVRRPTLSLGLEMVRTPKLAARLDAIAGSPGNPRCALPAIARRVVLVAAAAIVFLAGGITVAARPRPGLEITQQTSPSTGTSILAQAPSESPAKPEPAVQPEPEVHPLSLSGRALDPDGHPIEGATVFLVSTNGISKSLGQTTTDKEGRYAFRDIPLPVPAREDDSFFKSANFQVFGRAPGLAVAWRGMKTMCLDPRFERSPRTSETGFFPDEKIELDLEFETPHPVAGRFVDERGRPVAGVTVRLANCDYLDVAGRESHVNYREFWSLNQAADLMPEDIQVKSDADGRFVLKAVPPERICWLLINHPDFADIAVYVATSDRGVTEHQKHPVAALPLDMTLRSTRKIPVQVVYADTEKPAVGIRVGASQMRASGDSAFGVSDKEGKLLLKLPTGTYQLIGDPPRNVDYIRTREELEVTDKPDEQPVILKIDRGCVLILKAVDSETGKGIAGVSFWYEMTQPRPGRAGVQTSTVWIDNPKTNDQGELRAVVYPGKRRYGVGFNPLPAGYSLANPAVQVKGVELELSAENSITVEFELVRDPADEKSRDK